MTISPDEAVRLLSKWKNESVPVLICGEGTGFALTFSGTIFDFSPLGLVVSQNAPDGTKGMVAHVNLGLQGATHYEYLDLREAPGIV